LARESAAVCQTLVGPDAFRVANQQAEVQNEHDQGKPAKNRRSNEVRDALGV